MNASPNSRSRVIVFCLSGLIASCSLPEKSECVPFKDWGTETLNIQLPKPLPIDLSKIEANTVAKNFNSDVSMLTFILNGNYEKARSHWDSIVAIPDPNERMQALSSALYKLNGRGLYSLHAAQSWEKADPESKAAKLFLAAAYSHAASEGRGNKFSNKTTPEQFELLYNRSAKAEQIFQTLFNDDDAYSWAAKLSMVSILFYSGRSDEGWRTYEYLIGKAPQYVWLYLDAAEYAKPKWAGKQSKERTDFLLKLADKNKLNVLDRKVLEQTTSFINNDVENNPNPEAWRPYWLNRIKEAPHVFNLRGLLTQESAINNWPRILELSQQVIDKNPRDAWAWSQRAYALSEIGSKEDAFTATLAAAVLGSEWSMQKIIRSHLFGGLGRTPGDHETLFAYCQLGAAIGSAAGANCMGAVYTDGILGTPRDNAKAVQWHLLAARGGSANSQHDLAVLLPQVLPKVESSEAAQFWLRRSAEQEHEFAMKKIAAQGGKSNSKHDCDDNPNQFIQFISYILAIFKTTVLGIATP